MKSAKASGLLGMIGSIVIPGVILGVISGCGGPDPSSPAPGVSGLVNGPTLPALSGANVLPITVNGSLCSGNPNEDAADKPCVQVTLCDTTGSNCQTISDVLLDTGSFGLRVFKSALNTNLANALVPVTTSGQTVAECVEFGDGTSDWGPVEMAQIGLGGESRVQAPIQVIDSTFTGEAANCSSSDTTPVEAGFTAILGVGLFAQDCGQGCVANSGNGRYFSCTSSSCVGYGPTLAQQVTNPVALLNQDNNGVILEFPSISSAGAQSVNGYLVLGIGTQSTNVPGSVTVFPANPSYGEFSTRFNGNTYAESIVDSGSNGYFFDPLGLGSLPDCGGNNAGWFCPGGLPSFTGTNAGYSSATSSNSAFSIGNFSSLLNSSNAVFLDIGANIGDGGHTFDWGFPFFIGRNIYVGLAGAHANGLNSTGPYWAF